jgi:hypothetical protein
MEGLAILAGSDEIKDYILTTNLHKIVRDFHVTNESATDLGQTEIS